MLFPTRPGSRLRPGDARGFVLVLGLSVSIACGPSQRRLTAHSGAPEYSGKWAGEPVLDEKRLAQPTSHEPGAPREPCASATSSEFSGTIEAENERVYRIVGRDQSLSIDVSRGGPIQLGLGDRHFEVRAPFMATAAEARGAGDTLVLQEGPARDGTRTRHEYRWNPGPRAFELRQITVNEGAELRPLSAAQVPWLILEQSAEIPLSGVPWVRAHLVRGVVCVQVHAPGPSVTELEPGGAAIRVSHFYLLELPKSIASDAHNPELAGFVKGSLP